MVKSFMPRTTADFKLSILNLVNIKAYGIQSIHLCA